MSTGPASADGCGAPAGGAQVTAAADAGSQAVVQGKVTRNGSAVPVGYARLLNSDGDFVAEVPLGEDGGFRFFAAPGSWTLRALSAAGNGDAVVTPSGAGIHEVDVKIA